MTCACDETNWPPPLAIPAGLSDLPRQQFVFAELRRALLDRAVHQPALAEWRARAQDDYGVMWLEMWAYVGELLSLYDKAIADESYVRTAKLRPSLRRLLESLGYVPRPAVAASVELALIADGKQPVDLPVGTGFRSGAFGGNPPQLFELVTPHVIHPNLNQFPVVTPVASQLTGLIDSFLLSPQTANVAVDDVLLIELTAAASDTWVRRASAVERVVDDANRRLVKVTLDQAVNAGSGKPVDGVRVRKASRRVSLKTPEGIGEDPPSWGKDPYYWLMGVGAALGGASGVGIGVSSGVGMGVFAPSYRWYWVLDSQYRTIQAGDRVLITHNGETRWISVGRRVDEKWTLEPKSSTGDITIDIPNSDDDAKVPSRTIPAVQAVFSVIRSSDDLDQPSRKASASSPNWSGNVRAEDISVGIDLQSCGRVLGPAQRTVAATDTLALKNASVPINSTAATSRVMLRDAEDRGVVADGGIDLVSARLTIDPGEAWSPALAAPVEAFGNIVTAVRGETVSAEVLGSGDATIEHQAFKLAKKPLTYVAAAGAANAAGIASTLKVWVDGLQWEEANSFFGHGPGAQIYVVRQDDVGASTITFGDGVRGSRLPTGAGNVVASYRFGAGAASPPAGSITQIVRPVQGLARVTSPVAAGGGADAEASESIRTLAPRSALLLGRAISIEDFEVAARSTPGVITARADWSWENLRQRPVIKVWVVGGAGVANTAAQRLVAISDPDTPIHCEAATAIAATLTIDLELDSRRVKADILAAARSALLGEEGWLSPAQLGIDQPLLRSPLLAFVLSVPGVLGVRGVHWNGSPLTDYGVAPGVGAYFDLAKTTSVTGS